MKPYLSIVIPCRNEERHIRQCLDSVLNNEFPRDRYEVLVVDGMSQDGTRAILEEYSRRDARILILDNPKGITPAALNIGVRSAQGEVIMRMDAHTVYSPDYMDKCVRALDQNGADNVGGIWKIVPRDESVFAKGIVMALSHKFGIGNAHYRTSSRDAKPIEVDTVPFFCVRREVFDLVGMFNENLVRSQDMEFSLRLKKAGLKTLLVPSIVSYYYARSDMKSFCKHNFVNGVWAVLPFLHSAIVPVSFRHLVPLFFVLGLVGSFILALLWSLGWWLFGAAAGAYGVANLAASVAVAMKNRDPSFLLVMPVIFSSLHFLYGLGSLAGVAQILGSPQFWRRVLCFRRD